MHSIYRSVKTRIKATRSFKRLVLVTTRILAALSWRFRPSAMVRYIAFLRDWRRFVTMGGKASAMDFYPCLFDRTPTTRIDTHYFHQAIWAFRLIKESGVEQHVDIASDVLFVGLLTTVTNVTFVDIRPLIVSLPNYRGIGASITDLPFAENAITSLSCLHVIEHIGLGRYGDPLDPLGPEKACREIARVLQPGGNAYVSMPIGRPRVSFNGLRVFAASEVVGLFSGLKLDEMAIVDVRGNFVMGVRPETADIRESEGGLDFGLGMFRFTKPSSPSGGKADGR